MDESDLCPRCGEDVETPMHRFWQCRCNNAIPYKADLVELPIEDGQDEETLSLREERICELRFPLEVKLLFQYASQWNFGRMTPGDDDLDEWVTSDHCTISDHRIDRTVTQWHHSNT